MDPRLDLTACDREPIHIPGAVQPHGALLVLDRAEGRIEQAAGVTDAFFGQPPQACLERAADEVVPSFAGLALQPAPAAPGHVGSVQARDGVALDVTAHVTDGKLVLEFERAPDAATTAVDLTRTLELASAELVGAPTLLDSCHAGVGLFRRLTGFDRVMIYRFLPDGTSCVTAEDKAQDLPPFLNHHYPASDIPKQARDLYLRNLIRVIPDVGYDPAPLFAIDDGEPPLDMSDCTLRSVSPIHIQYLKNMEVGASASVSIVVDGALWGLVALHHRTPRALPFGQRALCRVLAGVLAQQIARREEADLFQERSRARTGEDELLALIGRAPDTDEALDQHIERLRRVIPAHGAAVRRGEAVVLAGRTPEPAQIRALGDWLIERGGQAPFASDSLSRVFPAAAVYPETASGLLAVTVCGAEPLQIFWFRAEQVEVIKWAGNPHKPVEAPAAGVLTPRRSFELWEETVRGRSEPWSAAHVEAADRLRRTLADLRRSRGVEQLNQALSRALNETERLVREKEDLLREGDHRIQNSLQVLASMFALQLRQTSDPAVREQLEEAMGRLQAVGLVHRQLHRTDETRFVDFDQYLHELIDELARSLGRGWSGRLHVESAPLMLPPELAVSTGLLITELVLNAVKHAYGYEPGPIEVQVAERSGMLRAVVRDRGSSGRSLAPANRSTGFGSRLITGLLDRLGGSIERAPAAPGLRVTLIIPLAGRGREER